MKINRNKIKNSCHIDSHKKSTLVTFRKSLIAATISTTLASPASANPQGSSIVSGSVNINSTVPRELLISNTPGAIINWQGFSIQSNEITRFLQQNAESAVLNRVVGNQRSDIFGKLLSNGRVFLINPNGIVFGEHAIIDTAGLVASSLNISDADFIAGKMHFEGDSGRIQNNGYIRVNNAGDVMLIAPDVTNAGVIQADDGQILLAAGRSITISNLDLEHIEFEVQAPEDSVLNLGKIVAKNGTIALFADTLMHGGQISANRMSRDEQGRIRLHGTSTVDVNGSISSRGYSVAGGDIAITGDKIRLQASHINVSGKSGGRVRIGGDFQGQGDLPKSSTTSLDATSQIHADASQHGDGGEVIVWSEGDTQTFAEITATGGSVSGDGGFVETSGKKTLAFGQPADVSATRGKPGTWLLDPEDIVIGDSEAESISSALNSGSNVSVKTSDGGDGEGNITVDAAIEKTQGEDASLKLEAHNNIDVNAPISSTSGELNVSLTASNRIHVNASVSTNGGSFSQVITELNVEIPSDDSSDDDIPEHVLDEELVAIEPEDIVNDDEEIVDDDLVEPDPIDPLADAELIAEEDGIELETVIDPIIAPDVLDVEINILGSEPNPDDAAILFKESMTVLIDADIDTNGGDVFIDSGSSGDLAIFKTIDASSEDGQGGDVTVLGQRVGLFEEAEIDASGSSGGGQVLFGGDQQGENPDVRNSEAVFIASEASIRSDATDNGDGGKVIVFAEDTANILGHLSARGGDNGGDGGFVETSGKRYIHIENAPDVRAPAGDGGTWLIDPYNLTVRNENPDVDVEDSTNSGITTWVGGVDAATMSYLSAASLIGSFTTVNNVIIHVDDGGDTNYGNLYFDADIDTNGTDMNSGSLILQADGNIVFTGSIYSSADFSSNLSSLSLIADFNEDEVGDVRIIADGGSTKIESQNRIDLSGQSISILGGDAADENIFINGRNSTFSSNSNLTIEGGSGSDSSVYVSVTNLHLDAVDTVSVRGGTGTGSHTYLVTAHTDVSGIDFTLEGGAAAGGGAHAKIQAASTETFDAQITGDFKILGGTVGENNYAYIDADNVVLGSDDYVLNSLQVIGGVSGFYNDAGIFSGGDLAATVAGDISIVGGSGGSYNGSSISASEDIRLSTDGDLVVQGGGGYEAYASIDAESVMTLSAKSIRVEGGSGMYSDASIELKNRYAVDDNVYTQTLTATGGDISIIGGSGEYASAEIGLYLRYDNDPGNSNIGQSAIQSISASGDITIMGGTNSSEAGILLSQNLTESGPAAVATGVVTVFEGSQTIASGGNINVLGGGDADGVATINFRQTVNLLRGNFVDDWDLTFEGTQRLSATGNVDFHSGSALARIDKTQFVGLGDLDPLDLSMTRNNKQYINADTLNITATYGHAGVFTGGRTSDADALSLTNYGADQYITANAVNLVSEITSGARAEIHLQDPNEEHIFQLDSDDVNLTEANGGIASINNEGAMVAFVVDDLTGTGNIEGNFNITVNNLLSPGNSPGTLNLPTLTLGAGATTLLEIESPSNLDQINVVGTATLNGDLDVVLLSGFVPSVSENFTFINAAGGISGGFSVTNTNFVGTSLSSTYDVQYTGPPAVTNPTTTSSPAVVVAAETVEEPLFIEPDAAAPPIVVDDITPETIDPLQPVLVMIDNTEGPEEEALASPVAIGLCTASNS